MRSFLTGHLRTARDSSVSLRLAVLIQGLLSEPCSEKCVNNYVGSGILPFLQANMKKALVTHSSPLAWKIPWTEEPGGLQSMGSLRVRHD